MCSSDLLLVDAIAVLACLGAPILRLVPGVSNSDGGPGLFDRILSMDRVRQVTVAGVTASAVIALLSPLFSVSPDTSWFGTLGRGQGTIFMIALGAILILATGDLRRPGTSALLVRILSIGALPVAISTVLQRFGIDPVSLTLCGVERVPTTIGNALPGATYLSVATLVALELARQAWLRRDDVEDGPAPSTVPATGPRRETARRRRRTVGAFGVTDTPVVRPGWQRPVAEASGALALLYGGMWAVRDDLSTTWLPIPLALVWGASVVRSVGLRPVVRWNVAFAGWLALAAVLLIGNGITLSRGPAAGFVLGLGIWIIALFTGAKPGTRLSSVAIPVALATAGTLVMVGAWFTPSTVCLATPGSRTAGASAPAPLPAASGGGVAPSGAEAKQPASATAPVAPPAPVAPSISDQTLSVVSSRVNIFTDPRVWSSVSWRTNIWEQSLVVYMDRPAPSAPRARSMAAALAGAQFGDVSRLNGLPDHRPAGSWWYRLFGYGPESQVFTLATSTSPDIRAVQGEITYDRAHNVVLDVLLTTGAVGLVAWAVNLGAAFLLGWRLRRLGTAGVATAALAPVLVCILVSGLSGVDATAITLINWVVIAMCIIVPTNVPASLPATAARRSETAPTGRRATVVAVPAESLGDELTRLGVVAGVLLAACVVASVLGLGATTPLAWAVGAFVGLCIAGLAVAERPFPRGRPDLGVITVTVVAALFATIVMVPGWSAMAAGHYARLTQQSVLPKDQVAALAKRAVALDPGQATYRVLAGMS